MKLSEYEAKRQELDAKMQKLNAMESEKKMELSIRYQAECKKISCKIGELKHKRAELNKDYQKDKSWWHAKFRDEKHEVTAKMHMLRLEYLTVNNIGSKESQHNGGGTSENGC